MSGILDLGSVRLSPSIHKFDDVFIHSRLSAALGHGLGPNGVSYPNDSHPIIRHCNCEAKHLAFRLITKAQIG